MRIAYLSAGAGSLICGACTHDFLTVASLRQLAHDVRVVPLYTPVHSDIGELGLGSRIFLGGVSAYLRVRKPGLARALRLVRPVLDSSALLTIATRGMIQTSPAKLGDMTLSVLQGEEGPHAAEFARLAHHIRTVAVPDVVILTNSMLAPIAGLMAGEKPIPVVSGFLGEDSFIMGLSEPYRTQCIELIRQHARSLRSVLCPSRSAMEQAGILLDLQPGQSTLVPAPVDVELYARPRPKTDGMLTIGYLSVIRPVKGLDVLVRAMQHVAEAITQPMRLLIAGQVVDPKYLRSVRDLIGRLPVHVQVEVMGEVTLEQKVAMLHQCDLVCTPSRIAETRGLAAMEAMAAGVPVIAPAIGCFPEHLNDGGGWLFEPENVDDLARRIASALRDPAGRTRMGEQALAYVRSHHHPQSIAQQMETVLSRSLVSPRASRVGFAADSAAAS